MQTILIAEDELIVAVDLCDTMSEAGYDVEGPHSGISSAMLAFQKEKPALAILDVELDDGNAFALAEKLIAEDVPVIFHSGQRDAAAVEQRFPAAITLSKPCPPTQLIETVNGILEEQREMALDPA